MLEESIEEVLTAMLGNQRAGDLVSQGLDILRDKVRHCPILGMTPTGLDHVQLRSIRGQELHVYPRAIEVPKSPRGFPMTAATIPDHEERALAVPGEPLDEGEDIVAGDVG